MTVTQPQTPTQPESAPPAISRPVRPARPTPAHSLRRHFLHASAPPKTFDHTGYADEVTLAAGALVHLAHFPWQGVAGAGFAAVVGAGFWANQMWQHRGITTFAAGTALASSAWVTWAAYDTPWSIGSIASLVAGTFLLGPVYGVCRWHTNKANQKEMAERALRAAERADAKQHQFVQILLDAGCPDIAINTDMDGDGWVKGERKFPAGFALALNHGRKAPDVAGLAQRIPEIEKIASGATTYPIRPGSIQIKPNPTRAHQSELIVPTRDVLAEEIVLEDRPGPRSIYDLIEVAVSVDGTVIGWDCRRDPHGMFAGQNNAGKSTFLNAHLSETTRSVDCATWMICGEKPVRGFAPWLGPFLEGIATNPVIDWFAADLLEAWMMLVDAIKLVQRRQESAATTGTERWEATPADPEVCIFIDESPDLLNSNERFPLEECPDDDDNYRVPTATFSELLLKLVRLGRSEGVHVVFLAQRGTVTMLGSEGGDLKSQVSYRAGFHATGAIDANAVFNTQTAGVRVESLPQGAMYIEMTGDARPVLAKGLRMTPEHIRRTAVEHAQYCGPLDAWSAEPLVFYAERWTRTGQQKFLRVLCPNAVRTVPGEQLRKQDPGSSQEPSTPAAESTLKDELIGEFQQWMSTSHPGDKPSEATVNEFFQHLYSDDGRDSNQRQAEIDRLEALFAAEPVAEPAQQVRQIDPSLPEDTRSLLAAIAASDLLLSEKYVVATDMLPLAEALGWSSSEAAGGRRIAAALKAVNVFRVEPRPRIDGKKATAYYVADLRAAVEKNTI